MAGIERLVLVGCGRWGAHVLRDLLALGCAVVVIDPDAGARASAEAQGARAVADLDDLDASLDGAVVASPSTLHAPQVEHLLQLGLRVFCEKPLTTDAESARRLVGLGEGRLFCMHKWRYHGGVEALAALVRAGDLGAPVGLETTRVDWGHTQRDVDCTWTLAPHDLSIALEVLGRIPTARAAVAERGADGEVLGLRGLLSDPDRPWLALTVSARAPSKRRELRLHCEDGVAILPAADAPALTLLGRVGERREVPVDSEQPLLRQLRAFVEHLRGGPPPKSDAACGLQVVESLVALRRLAGVEA